MKRNSPLSTQQQQQQQLPLVRMYVQQPVLSKKPCYQGQDRGRGGECTANCHLLHSTVRACESSMKPGDLANLRPPSGPMHTSPLLLSSSARQPQCNVRVHPCPLPTTIDSTLGSRQTHACSAVLECVGKGRKTVTGVKALAVHCGWLIKS